MRIILFTALITFYLSAHTQSSGTYYVAAKTGLSIREKPDAASKVLDKIPYGTKVTTLDENSEWKEIVTEGLRGYWRKVKYNNKTGYIVDSYLFPWPPPKLGTITDMKKYLAQVTLPAGAKVVTKSGSMNQIQDGGWELTKQLYKNGSEHHQFLGYEYASDTYFLPGFSLQQGFLLCRLIPEFKQVFGEKDEFPSMSKKVKKGEIDYDITLIKEKDEPEYSGPLSIEKIKIEYTDGATYIFEMFMLENQLVIFYASGV